MVMYRNPELWAAIPGLVGEAASHIVGGIPSFIPLDNRKEQKP